MAFEGKSKHDKLFIRLSYNVVTRDVDRDVSTAYCQSTPYHLYHGDLMLLADFDLH